MNDGPRRFSELSMSTRVGVLLLALAPVAWLAYAGMQPDEEQRRALGMGALLVLPIFECTLAAFTLWRMERKDFWLHAIWVGGVASAVVAVLGIVVSIALGAR